MRLSVKKFSDSSTEHFLQTVKFFQVVLYYNNNLSSVI